MKKLLSILFLLGSLSATAQKITISGYVTDAISAEKLIGATVYIPSLKVGTNTNVYGFYSITIPEGKEELEVVCSYISYSAERLSITPDKNQKIEIKLSPSKQLKGVAIKSTKIIPIQEKTQMSSIDMPIELIKKLPAFMGEVDILKALQLLPGVQAGSEGQTGLYVRGGGPDQNLILLDGVPVYNASHLFGFFSVFNADAIKSVELYKGGFPARYGGRLSSVVDIRMKEGTKNGIHGSLGIGLIASRLMLEGPFGKKSKRGSWMISGRRTYIDILTAPIIKAAADGDGTGGYYFYDLNGKVNYKIGKRDHLYLSGYFGNDKFYAKSYFNKEETDRANIKWGNKTALLRWNHEFSQKLFGNLSATYSKYRFGIYNRSINRYNFGGQNIEETYTAIYSSSIQDWALKYDVDFIPNTKHYVKAGISGILHTFTPGAITYKNSIVPEQNIDTTFQQNTSPEFDVYIEDDVELTSKLKANIGIHASAFASKNNFYPTLQPRVSLRYLVKPSLSVKASYSNMTQFIHLLSNNGIGLPTDLWVPVTDKIKPQRSDQVAIGLAKTFKEQYEISIEGYYKEMRNIIDYFDGASYLNTNQSWEDKVEMGKGWSYGAEFFVQKKTGRLNGLIGYTLSWTNRKFPTINSGLLYPYKYDRRHDFKMAGVYKVSDRVELSGEWVYGSGNAISLPEFMYASSFANNFNNNTFHYGERNARRMRAYHRMDIGVNLIKQKAKGRERTWNISIYNAYSRKNPFYIYNEYNASTRSNNFKQISLFPILPSFSYNLKF